MRRPSACWQDSCHSLIRFCRTRNASSAAIACWGADEQSQLDGWNLTAAPFPSEMRVDQLIASNSANWSARTAVEDGVGSFTYAELNARANRLARELRHRGIGREALVGLCVERSAEMVIAQLAILKAGAAYVPLDPAYPAERLRYMAQDARLQLLVTDAAAAAALDWPPGNRLMLDVDARVIEIHSDAELPADAALDAGPLDPAYVIYTSGSSGKPKGVVVPHNSVVNLLTSMASKPGLRPEDRLLAVTTLSFDIAVLELLLPLSVGACVVLASRDHSQDGVALRAKLESAEVNVMQATPTTWQMLIAAGWRGSATFKVLVGGEALSPDLANQLLHRSGELWNMYGPTETTVWSSCWRVRHPLQGICIGTPIANTQMHILDSRLQPCPIGVPGEICISGAGVATGYLNRPDLSAERFVANLSSAKDGGRLYRTGDRGRWRHDGQLEHLGRFDFQVKLRGHRIELGEIEACLSVQEQVAWSIAMVREDRPGDARLVAYVVPQYGTPEIVELRRRLRLQLPEYMVPRHYVLLDVLPLLPNGKVDRAALPKPTETAVIHDTAFWVPRTDAEVAIAQVWSQLLDLERVSSTDNFFDLGGHSLLAMRAVSDIHKRLGVRLSPRRLMFETLAQLAANPGKLEDEDSPVVPARASTVKYLVGGLQRMLLSKSQRNSN